jgi:type VI secretion lipoprotein, VC_A0113 family
MLITKKQLTNNKPVVIELVDNKVLLQETVKKVK